MRQMLVVGFIVLSVALWQGCGKDNPLGRVAVSGTVTLDGAPLESGSIMFAPTQRGPVLTGTVIKAGRFEMLTEKGLTPGEYAVKINAPDMSKPTSGHEPPPSLIPPDWSNGTGHKVTVTAQGPNEFTFDIKK